MIHQYRHLLNVQQVCVNMVLLLKDIKQNMGIKYTNWLEWSKYYEWSKNF